jgi:hypothetical protein
MPLAPLADGFWASGSGKPFMREFPSNLQRKTKFGEEVRHAKSYRACSGCMMGLWGATSIHGHHPEESPQQMVDVPDFWLTAARQMCWMKVTSCALMFLAKAAGGGVLREAINYDQWNQ